MIRVDMSEYMEQHSVSRSVALVAHGAVRRPVALVVRLFDVQEQLLTPFLILVSTFPLQADRCSSRIRRVSSVKHKGPFDAIV